MNIRMVTIHTNRHKTTETVDTVYNSTKTLQLNGFTILGFSGIADGRNWSVQASGSDWLGIVEGTTVVTAPSFRAALDLLRDWNGSIG